jgi:hypothetical protein
LLVCCGNIDAVIGFGRGRTVGSDECYCRTRAQKKRWGRKMESYANGLGLIANIAAIFTAAIAVFGYGAYRLDQNGKRKRLENYLKAEKSKGKDRGQRSLLHLMANVGMTEAELIQASFRSHHIDRKIAQDMETGRADALLLQWRD